jgi:DNA-binding SARP family transcriptional activator/tetratricopeptide (TPR) repeat protein
MQFSVLGPLDVRTESGPVRVTSNQQRVLLATLLCRAGATVAVERLFEAVWADRVPKSGPKALQVLVHHLRRRLGDDRRIVYRPGGYTLVASPKEIDAYRFEQLLSAARDAADPARAARLREALGLWRGDAYEGLTTVPVVREEATRLTEHRFAALTELIDLDLADRPAAVVPELARLTGEHPLREEFRGRLMLALYRSDRQADALSTYREGHRLLADELGVEPGPRLQWLHRAILTGNPALDDVPQTVTTTARPSTTADQPAAPPAGPPAAPWSVPADVAGFTGRTAELARITGFLDTACGTTPVVVISGPPGTGKTALAVHAAHRLRARFSDGALYAYLGGPRRGHPDTEDVLTGLLLALGVTSSPGLRAKVALFRRSVGGRRVLVVLDDVGSAARIRPLIPGDAGSAVLVTARSPLPVAGALSVELGVLPPADALGMLAAAVGPARVEAEPVAADTIVELCDRLPLAVRIAGARLTARPHWTLAKLAGRLRDEQSRLDELSVGDLAVRASLALSYDGLVPDAQRALRRLAELDPPDFAAWLAGPVLDLPPAAAENLVETLVDARLLDVAGTDAAGQVRYRFHDLVRLYARERAAAEDGGAERTSAVDRAVAAFLTAVRRTRRGGLVLPVDGDDAGYPVPVPGQDAGPAVWLAAEEPALVAAVRRSSTDGRHGPAGALAHALVPTHFAARNRFAAWEETHRVTVTAARRAKDRRAEAVMLLGLGQLRYEQDRFRESTVYLTDALAAFASLDDGTGRAAALLGLATVGRETGRYQEALRHLCTARAAFTRADERAGVAEAWYGIGTVHRELGADQAAISALTTAAETFRALGDRSGEARAVRGIGLVWRARGDYPAALRTCDRAYRMAADAGDGLIATYARQSVAKAAIRLGAADEALAELTDARASSWAVGDRFGVALIDSTLAEGFLVLGRVDRAVHHGARALAGWTALAIPPWRARTLRDLADAHEAAGDRATAVRHRREADAIFYRLGSREAFEPVGDTRGAA